MAAHGTTRSGSGESFFKLIQSHLDNKFSGRLMALILCELGRQEPEAFLQFLKLAEPAPNTIEIERRIRRGGAQFEREWSFRKGRYADVAVLIGGEPAIVIEVKEDDLNTPRNPSQLKDYCDWQQQNPAAIFIHLSRYTPMKALPKLIEASSNGGVHDLRYRHLHRAVSSYEKRSRGTAPLSRMVREYLEESGVNTYKTISLDEDRAALTFVVTQMTGFGHFHGLGRMQSASSVTRGPVLLATLLGNASVFGDWIHEPNARLITQRPQTRFYAKQRYKPKLLAAAALSTDEDGLAEVPSRAIQDGTLTVSARAKLKGAKDTLDQWIYLELGTFVNVSAVDKERARLALYASIEWKGGKEVYSESDDWLFDFPSETAATSALRAHLKLVIDKAKRQIGYPAALDEFKIPKART